jgi:hypothetical protein
MVQARDMTIFGPFGGEAGSGGPELETRQRRMSSMFHGGSAFMNLHRPSAPPNQPLEPTGLNAWRTRDLRWAGGSVAIR